MQLRFREQGDGPPLIILHGLFGSLENWGFISQQLAPHFRVISVDLRNHGQSPHDPLMNYSVLAEDLREFMEQRNIPSASLLGHSMGGKAAMSFALLHSECVDRLVVVDMAPRAYELRHENIFNALLALDLQLYETRAEIEKALEPRLPDLSVRRFLLKGLSKTSDGKFEWKFNLRALRGNYPALTAALTVEGTFGNPTLFIRGGESDYIRDADVPEIMRLFPKAKIATITGASHWVHAEKPEEFLSVVREFLTA
jgi:esterase